MTDTMYTKSKKVPSSCVKYETISVCWPRTLIWANVSVNFSQFLGTFLTQKQLMHTFF